LTIDTTGWIETEVTETSRAWTSEGDTLWVHYFPIPPDLPKPVGDDSVLVDRFHQGTAKLPGGLVEARWTMGPDLLPIARIIIKSPQECGGISYLGSLIGPFHACSWVVRVEAPEFGVTGAREAIWAAKVSKSEGISFHQLHDRLREENDRLRAQYGGSGFSRQPSDDEEWDSMLPDHPLSRVRRYLPLLASSIVLAGKAQRLAPFR
jgi:hypothetical protein